MYRASSTGGANSSAPPATYGRQPHHRHDVGRRLYTIRQRDHYATVNRASQRSSEEESEALFPARLAAKAPHSTRLVRPLESVAAH